MLPRTDLDVKVKNDLVLQTHVTQFYLIFRKKSKDAC